MAQGAAGCAAPSMGGAAGHDDLVGLLSSVCEQRDALWGGTVGAQGSGRQSWRFVMQRQKGFEKAFGASLSRAPVLFHCNENEAKTLSLAEQNGLSRVHSGPGGASCDLNRAQALCSLTPASSVLAFLSSSADRGSGWSALVLVRVPFCVRHQHHSVEDHLCTKAHVRIRPPRPYLLSPAGSMDATVPSQDVKPPISHSGDSHVSALRVRKNSGPDPEAQRPSPV